MSYSIGPVRGATKADVMIALTQEFDRIVLPSQPVHAFDRETHLTNVRGQLALLADDPGQGKEFAVSMNGWLSYISGTTHPDIILGGGFGGSAQIVDKVPVST